MESKKSQNWTQEEVLKLLSIWSGIKDKFKSCTNRAEVYIEMRDKLLEEGVDRNVTQIQKKMSNLKEDFKRKKPGITGSSPSNWVYYEQMSEILGSSHFYNQELAHTQDSLAFYEDQNSPSNSINSSSSQGSEWMTPSKGSKRKRKSEELNKDRKEAKELMLRIAKSSEEAVEEFKLSTERMENEIKNVTNNINTLVQLLLERENK